MSTLLPMGGNLGLASNSGSSIPYEAAKQLLGEDLLVNIECLSKGADKGGVKEEEEEEEGGSEVSGGTIFTGAGFSSKQQQQPFDDDLFGHQIYQGILGKYCRTTRINQQLAEVLPNHSSKGWTEYDYYHQHFYDNHSYDINHATADKHCIYDYADQNEKRMGSWPPVQSDFSSIQNNDPNSGGVDDFYASKIAASFLSMDRSNNMISGGQENIVRQLQREEWMSSLSNYDPAPTSCQPPNFIDDLQLPARVIRGGPSKPLVGCRSKPLIGPSKPLAGSPPKPLIVRVSNSNSISSSPTMFSQQKAASHAIFSAFTLSSLHHQLGAPNKSAATNSDIASADTRNSLKHIPPKQMLAQNLEESIRNRQFRSNFNSRFLNPDNRCMVRINQGNLAALTALTDSSAFAKNHRGSKGPRPEYASAVSKGNRFPSNFNFNQNTNNNKSNNMTFNDDDKLNNRLDLDNQDKRNQRSKNNNNNNNKTRRNRNRKQQQQQQQQMMMMGRK